LKITPASSISRMARSMLQSTAIRLFRHCAASGGSSLPSLVRGSPTFSSIPFKQILVLEVADQLYLGL
jgi:hypothetical protein